MRRTLLTLASVLAGATSLVLAPGPAHAADGVPDPFVVQSDDVALATVTNLGAFQYNLAIAPWTPVENLDADRAAVVPGGAVGCLAAATCEAFAGTTGLVGPALSSFTFARHGIPPVAVNPAVRARTTTTLSVTPAQLLAIYEDGNNVCDSTVTWGQLGDTGLNAADLVVPAALDPASPYFGPVNGFVGGTLITGDCVAGAALNPPALGGWAAAGLAALYNGGQGLWWFGGATLRSSAVQSAGLSPMQINGVNFAAAAFPLQQGLSIETRDTDAAWCIGAANPVAACAAAGTLAGPAGGPAGAVRDAVAWLCRLNHGVNPWPYALGASYLNTISGQLQASGFSLTVPGANFGRCNART